MKSSQEDIDTPSSILWVIPIVEQCYARIDRLRGEAVRVHNPIVVHNYNDIGEHIIYEITLEEDICTEDFEEHLQQNSSGKSQLKQHCSSHVYKKGVSGKSYTLSKTRNRRSKRSKVYQNGKNK